MLLDFLTVFFIVGGCALLWLNLRRRRPRIISTKIDDAHQSAPTRHISDEAEIRTLLAALKTSTVGGPGQPGSSVWQEPWADRSGCLVAVRTGNP